MLVSDELDRLTCKVDRLVCCVRSLTEKLLELIGRALVYYYRLSAARAAVLHIMASCMFVLKTSGFYEQTPRNIYGSPFIHSNQTQNGEMVSSQL